MRTRIDVTFTAGTRSIDTGITDLTIEDIRLIVNETQKKVLCSSMQKDLITSVTNGVVTYVSTNPALAQGDKITFEIDKGDDYPSAIGVVSEIASGKQAIAAALTQKGVQDVSPTDSFNKLAQDIQSMEIQQVTIDGGQMYANQMTGDGVLWDLYTILVQMKSQFMVNGYSYNGVLYKYSALIVCEYYKGYDSLVLQGADAYFTCDGDFYNYASPNHIWHDSDNGKMNRWVCFLFTDEGARLDITNTAISPRSMYIGGHIGTIEYFVNGRLTELVCGVEDTDVVDYYLSNTYTQEWNFNCILRNVKNILNETVYGFTTLSKGLLYIDSVCTIDNNAMIGSYITAEYANSIIVRGAKMPFLFGSNKYYIKIGSNTISLSIPDLEVYRYDNYGGVCYFITGTLSSLQVLNIPSLKNFQTLHNYGLFHLIPDNSCASLIDFIVGEFENNLRFLWNPTNVLADPDKTATLIDNIKNHILARVSDATGSTQLVFTVSTNLYNAIANENIEWQGEIMTLADAFLTKNWLFAGA